MWLIKDLYRFVFMCFSGNMLNLDWSFTTPGSVTGMKGSCVIIPCTFSYSNGQPSGLQVVWYLYQSNGRADVFNQKQSNILSRYKGITRLTGSVSDSNCSLKIDRLDTSHNEDKLYPWVDINPITSYHSQGHSFLDRSTKIIVSGKNTYIYVALLCSSQVQLVDFTTDTHLFYLPTFKSSITELHTPKNVWENKILIKQNKSHKYSYPLQLFALQQETCFCLISYLNCCLGQNNVCLTFPFTISPVF